MTNNIKLKDVLNLFNDWTKLLIHDGDYIHTFDDYSLYGNDFEDYITDYGETLVKGIRYSSSTASNYLTIWI